MKYLRPAALAVAVVALAAACGGGKKSSTNASSTVKEGGVFRLGTSSRIDSLNPFVAFNQDAYTTFMYIYPFLVQYDKQLHFAPDFATSWKASQDGKTWTFKTRPNAKWSDGTPLTAADAAWTINTDVQLQGGAAANAAGLVAHIKNATAPDPNTLVVHYTAPVGNVLAQFQQLAILPKHVWAPHAANKGKTLKSFPNAPPIVSGGPFQLTKFKKDEIALFKRNPSFYGPKPHIAGFGLQMFSNDDAMISALKAHELDALETVPPTAIKTTKAAGFVVEQVPGVTENDFIINSNPKKTNHRELLNPKVKEAMERAIDRNQIVHVAWLDTAKPSASIIPASTGEWHDPAVKPLPFDIAAANQLLDSLGYKKGGDGIRVADGQKMSYQVIVPNDLTGVDRTFQIIQTDFRKIGIALAERSLDSSAAFDAITAPGTKYLNFDLAMWDWVPLIDPDFMLSVVTCAQYGGWSDSGYCNKEYDSMYAKQGQELDTAKRRQLVYRMQEKLARDRPYIFLNTESWISARSPKWAGWIQSPQGPFNSLSKQSLTELHQVG